MWFCYDSLFFLVVKITTNGWKKNVAKQKPSRTVIGFCFAS